MGVDRAVAVVEHGEHIELFENAGVDIAINPRRATAEEIIEFARDQNTQHVAFLEGGDVQAIEVRLDEDSVLLGAPIAETSKALPDGVVIGAVTRNGSYLMPRGDTVLQVGDHVVIMADNDVLTETMERV
jgi:trk system potassium uptake protein TrkA